MNNEVKIVKLVNGDTYIGKVQFNGDEDVWLVNSAVALELQPAPNGNGVQVGFAPVSYFIEQNEKGNDIVISDIQVLFVDKPSKQIYDEYNKQFGSGLIGSVGPSLITE
ncbi:hypothetical protein [Methanohalobium sp.]|uniref:hypothetical protein n=1 Tax=Methanohalobium sp. TaxID=2837493 RepID=UPI0025F590E7|nr:hypothetical protein [Methanohalobium sp.]